MIRRTWRRWTHANFMTHQSYEGMILRVSPRGVGGADGRGGPKCRVCVGAVAAVVLVIHPESQARASTGIVARRSSEWNCLRWVGGELIFHVFFCVFLCYVYIFSLIFLQFKFSSFRGNLTFCWFGKIKLQNELSCRGGWFFRTWDAIIIFIKFRTSCRTRYEPSNRFCAYSD